MKPDGRAENALEQLLWAYAMGRAFDQRRAAIAREPVTVTIHEANTMFQATCGIQPRRDDLNKWLKELNRFLSQLPDTI